MRNKSAQRIALSGLLTSLMLVFGFIERQFPLPVPVPGIKLGLANSVLLYALYMLGCVIAAYGCPQLPLWAAFNLVFLICIPLRYWLYKFTFIALRTREQ